MRTTPADIKANKNSVLNFSAELIDDDYITKIAEALRSNTAGTYLNLSLCELNDFQFGIIVEALLQRSTSLEELNLDYNDLTPASLPLLSRLIESNKVSRILHYDNQLLNKSKESVDKLQSLAIEHGVTLLCQNRLHREFPDFFAEQRKKIGLSDSAEEKEHISQVKPSSNSW